MRVHRWCRYGVFLPVANGRLQMRSNLQKQAMVRGMVFFTIGLLLKGHGPRNHFDHWRVYAVLQRIAICYVITAGDGALDSAR
jgi:predicted acyltransferase